MKRLAQMTPTDIDYKTFDGMHCRCLWTSLTDTWQCPSCKRTKREIMRWGKRRGSNRTTYGPIGWKGVVVHHHDHGQRWSWSTIICGDCNAVDGFVKSKLRLPTDWSYTAQEIGQFAKMKINGAYESINYDIAKDIFDRANRANNGKNTYRNNEDFNACGDWA